MEQRPDRLSDAVDICSTDVQLRGKLLDTYGQLFLTFDL